MATEYNYERINVTICPMEKDTKENKELKQTRMDVITKSLESKGVNIEKKYNPYVDYTIKGTLIKTVANKDELFLQNIGIQVKLLGGDFFYSIDSLSDNMFRIAQEYNKAVLIVIENGSYNLRLSEDETDAYIENKGAQAMTGKNGIGRFSTYINFMASMQESGIFAIRVRNNEELPLVFFNLMRHNSRIRDGLCIKPVNPEEKLIALYSRFDGVGPKGAAILQKQYPIFELVIRAPISELQSHLGLLNGKKLYHQLHGGLTLPVKTKLTGDLTYNDRVLSLIKNKPMLTTELREEVGVSSETIMRILMELKACGKIQQDESTRKWFPANKCPNPSIEPDPEFNIGV